MADSHRSDSGAQSQAEAPILALLEETLGTSLERGLEIPIGTARIQPDGAAADESVFVEVFAHIGKLRGGQRHKVSTDALKLLAIRETHPDARLILAFADEAAAASVSGWRVEILRTNGIEIHVVPLSPADRAAIEAAQTRQAMVNAPVAPSPPRHQPMTVEKIVAALRAAPQRSVAEARALAPAEPGFYSWWARPESLPPEVPRNLHPDTGSSLLYVGIAPASIKSQGNLAKRLRIHTSGAIDSSTLRRGLAALLYGDLGWRAIWASTRPGLENRDLAALSDWQTRNLTAEWSSTRSLGRSSRRSLPQWHRL